MDIRIICIGDELLSGDTLNTNLAYAGTRLSECGYRVAGECCVPDDKERMTAALKDAEGADIVILIGGLGPTRDDLTRPLTSAFLGRELRFHPEMHDRIAAYLGERYSERMRDAVDTQSMIPEGATILENRNGTAPGLLIEEKGGLWFMLPGPPREMRPMFEASVLPRIQKRGNPEWEERTFRVVGIGESYVEAAVRETLGEDANRIHIAYCIKEDCVMVKISQRYGEAKALLDDCAQRLVKRFGANLIPEGCTSAVEYLGRILKERGLVIATAESCTGGGIAAAMTEIPGSSEWFHGAFVTYTNEWKKRLLGVRAEVLEDFGAVSHQTVMDMLDGVMAQEGIQLGIAVSGIAGPGGGTDEKPVGTVYVGIAGPGWRFVRRKHFNGLRETVRQRTRNEAVGMMLSKLLS